METTWQFTLYKSDITHGLDELSLHSQKALNAPGSEHGILKNKKYYKKNNKCIIRGYGQSK